MGLQQRGGVAGQGALIQSSDTVIGARTPLTWMPRASWLTPLPSLTRTPLTWMPRAFWLTAMASAFTRTASVVGSTSARSLPRIRGAFMMHQKLQVARAKANEGEERQLLSRSHACAHPAPH